MKRLHTVVGRLRRLADTLAELKERVRDAVAGELSRVVAHAVQEAVHALVRGTPEPPPPEFQRDPLIWRDDDPWSEEMADERVPREFDVEDEPAPPPAPDDRWRRAVALGTTVLRWWPARRWRPLVGLGVAGLAGAAWWGGPAVHAGTSVILAAAELIAFGTSHSLR